MAFNGEKPVYEPVAKNFAGRPDDSILYAPAPEGLFVVGASDDMEPAFVSLDDMSPAWTDVRTLSDFENAIS